MSSSKYEKLSSNEHEENGVAITTAVVALKEPEKRTQKNTSSFCFSLLKFLLLLCVFNALLLLILAAFAFHGAHHFFHKVGERVVPMVTLDHPQELPPPVYLSKSELINVKNRLHEFHQAMHHNVPLDLVLSQDEINGLICDKEFEHHDHHDSMCGHVYVTLSTDTIRADYSIPAPHHAPGRYFVGTKSLEIVSTSDDSSSYSIQGAMVARIDINHQEREFTVAKVTSTVKNLDGDLDIRIASANLLEWTATQSFVGAFFNANFASHMCPHAKKSLEHIEGVEIQGNKVIVRVKKHRDTNIVTAAKAAPSIANKVVGGVGGGTRNLLRG